MSMSSADMMITAERKVLTFTLEDQVFGIDMEPVIEVREWEEPTSIPGAPSYLRGVTNIRGTVVPIVDLAERLGWAPTTLHSRSCVVVTELGERQIGFLVNQVADIMPIKGTDIEPCPDVDINEREALAGLVQMSSVGRVRKDNETAMVILLNPAALSFVGCS